MPTEKEQFLTSWEREHGTTLRVLKSMPENKIDMKPTEKSKSVKDLAWGFAAEEKVFVKGIITGKFDFANTPKAPGTLQEIISEYEKSHKEMVGEIKNLSEADWNGTVKFFVAKDQMGDVRRGDMFWMAMMDGIHHRGQFSVYLRLAGAKVPSIYGPTADEPWM